MENYENLGTIGEGTYGVVMKCRHKETGQIVAIKKFKESDEDEQVRKTAIREIRILKQLRHDNIVNLIDVFRSKNKLYLVFEYLETTILGKLEKYPYGVPEDEVKKYFYQLLKGVEYCHFHNIIHRDIKPENLLVSKSGVLKLCDFGFARTLEGSNAKYTDYVSTRWYRAPELLVGDREYGKPVDIWAVGCMFAEIVNGMPLFPGDSDIDQLFHIINCFGRLSERQMEIFRQNPMFNGVELPQTQDEELQTLEKRFPTIDKNTMDLMKLCLHYEPERRGTYQDLIAHPYFNGIEEWYHKELKGILEKDNICGMALQMSLLKKPKDVQKNAQPQQQNQRKKDPKKFKLAFEVLNNPNGQAPLSGETENHFEDGTGALPNIHVQRIVAMPYLTGDQPTTRRDDISIPPITGTQVGGGANVNSGSAQTIQTEGGAEKPYSNSLPSSFGSLPTISDFKYVKNPAGQGKKKKYNNNQSKQPKRDPNTPATPMKSTRGQGNSIYTSIVMGESSNFLVGGNQFSGSGLPSRGSPEQLFSFPNKKGSKRYVSKII